VVPHLLCLPVRPREAPPFKTGQGSTAQGEPRANPVFSPGSREVRPVVRGYLQGPHDSEPCPDMPSQSARYECLEGLAHIDILLKAEFISWNPGDQLFDEGEHFRYEAAVIPGY